MDICKTILEAITCALKSEERRLKPRSEQKPKIWPWTVRGGYGEDWTRYLLVRELTDRFPKLELEIEAKSGGVRRLDLLICGHAAVELKGPYWVKENFDEGLYNKILEDFEKQRCRATVTNEPNLQHFVLLIVHAPKQHFDSGSVQNWLVQLDANVQKEVPGICIMLQPSEPFILNGDDRLMRCCLYSIS